jgi:nicotinamidase/pyrazinamidase
MPLERRSRETSGIIKSLKFIFSIGKHESFWRRIMKALIIVDIQYDFCPGGALAVEEGDSIVPLINELQKQFGLIVATQDWHPAGHASFASTHGRKPYEVIDLDGIKQTLWPDHCVQGSLGAELLGGLNKSNIAKIIRKGTDPAIDSYSAFYDNAHKKATGLEAYLKEHDVTEIYLAGLATDYCVKYSALDAVSLGFKTNVFLEACRGVNVEPGDVEKAVEEMKKAGVRIIEKIG